MSFVGVLAGRDPVGVYLWSSEREVTEILHTAEVAGWGGGYVDGWTLPADRRAVLAAMGEALGFGEWFGANYDALADSLRDLTEPFVLLWDGWGVLARAEPRAFDTLVAILGRHAQDSDAGFAVLLRGEGPEVSGIAALD